MIREGIFLGYEPGIPLRNEGLGRLLAFLVSGWVRLPQRRLTIACPYWLVADVESLLAEHGVPRGDYDMLRTEEPWWHRLRDRLRQTAGKRSRGAWLAGLVTVDFHRMADAKQFREVLGDAAKLAVCLAAVVWVLSRAWPLLAVLAGGLVVYRVWRKKRLKRRGKRGPDPARAVRRQAWIRARYAKELRHLIDRVNQQQAVRHWLVPTSFWPAANTIAHAKSMVCPDLVLHEFPLRFADPATEPIYAQIVDALQHADRLICYSEYTKRHHLVHGIGADPERIDVIGHARIDLGDALRLGAALPDPGERSEIALELLRSHQRAELAGDPYWNRFAWDTQAYVFYAAQARGQKNILTLLRAVEILRRRTREPVRLVLTCQRVPESEIDRFVSARQLDAWVLFAPGVSHRVLAALYCHARLAVNPTLFEGGFPFTFTEAYSVGTPSLLSDIPVVRERLDRDHHGDGAALRSRTLFDPHDPQDLAAKIEWGVGHRVELLRLQRPLFDGFPTWQAVAERYAEALRSTPSRAAGPP